MIVPEDFTNLFFVQPPFSGFREYCYYLQHKKIMALNSDDISTAICEHCQRELIGCSRNKTAVKTSESTVLEIEIASRFQGFSIYEDD